MDGRGARRALDEARDVLTHVYDRARAAGYQAGSRAMHDLEQAERHYQQARRRAHPIGDPLPGGPVAVEGQPGDVVLDLTDERQQLTARREGAGAPAASSVERAGQPVR